jgi:hypothetical protein
MRRLLLLLLLLLASAANTAAQAPSDLQVRLELHWVSVDGGEKFAGASYINRVAIGKSETATFSSGARCDAWALSAKTGLLNGATKAWRVETTPVRVVGDAVTFRLRWIHAANLPQQLSQLSFEQPSGARLPGDDIELTLRPGEFWEVDRVALPRGTDVHGDPCPVSAKIRATVDVYPGANEEQRLLGVDLWLVERLADGSEVARGQQVTVRGLPYRPVRFDFDRIADGNSTLDMFGTLTTKPSADGMTLSVETRSRWTPEKRNIAGPQRFLNSEVQVKPAEAVDIRLPLLGVDAGPFAKRAFSIRIRARQIR